MLLHKKIVAFDLDGTLAESKQKLRYDMAELLLRLMKQSKVVIISGGAFPQFDKQVLSSLREVARIIGTASGAAAHDDADAFGDLILLPTGGSQRYEFDKASSEWKMIHSVHFPIELKEKVFMAFDDMRGSEEYDIPTDSFGPAIEDRGTQMTFSALGQNAPLDKKKAWDPDQAKRKKIKAYLDPILAEADIFIGGSTSIDILPKGCSKATGLCLLLESLGMAKEDMEYVGDALFPGGNDYSVLEAGIRSVRVASPMDTAKLIGEWLAEAV